MQLTFVGVISKRKMGPRNRHCMTPLQIANICTRSVDEKLIQPLGFHVFYHMWPRRRIAETKDKQNVNASNTIITRIISDMFDQSARSRRNITHRK